MQKGSSEALISWKSEKWNREKVACQWTRAFLHFTFMSWLIVVKESTQHTAGGSKPDKAQTPLQGDFVVKQKQSKETAP
jgi:hypothetical protein